MKTVSMFAAISCSCRSLPGARRRIRLVRSSTRLARGRARSSSSQSPTVASGPGGIVSSMPSPATCRPLRCTATTRTGGVAVSASASIWRAKTGPQPSRSSAVGSRRTGRAPAAPGRKAE